MQCSEIVSGVGWYFHFYLNSKRAFYEQKVETLIRRGILSESHCLPMASKKDARLIWVKLRSAPFEVDTFAFVSDTVYIKYLINKNVINQMISYSPSYRFLDIQSNAKIEKTLFTRENIQV